TMSKLLTILISFILGAVVASAIGFYSLPGFMIKEIPSPYGFEETMVKVKANAKGLGWKVPKSWKINFQKNLQKTVKVDIGPNQVMGMCEPQAAADILKHDQLKQLAVMMPCKIAVYEKSDGKTYISIMNMNLLGTAFGDTVKGITTKLAPQMEKMVTLEAAK
ncbi:MAG: DUF302 domain-containing protein, partial [Thiotrichaceae bacterium]|nr:DUF302 domain-containing protein [Thiotrichaceae bacterium]